MPLRPEAGAFKAGRLLLSGLQDGQQEFSIRQLIKQIPVKISCSRINLPTSYRKEERLEEQKTPNAQRPTPNVGLCLKPWFASRGMPKMENLDAVPCFVNATENFQRADRLACKRFQCAGMRMLRAVDAIGSAGVPLCQDLLPDPYFIRDLFQTYSRKQSADHFFCLAFGSAGATERDR
jgi:hypothetical protein